MAKDYNFTMGGHPNIYNGYSPRDLNVYFSEPENGINKDTGLLLFIPGFGAHANSNVYRKMRSNFADQYNLVTIQCDYFGWEFMQSERLPESKHNFNDMGIMQALDNITAITAIVEIIKDNGMTFNVGKVIAYGHSHGAYLTYLCNIFAPGLFTLMIDNSAWLFPSYILDNRVLHINGVIYEFNYMAGNIIQDVEILNLPTISMGLHNQCSIYSFHGANDNIITLMDKRDFCATMNNCELHEISDREVDGEIFKSSSHGLEADFLLLFDHVIQNPNIQFSYKELLSIDSHRIETSMYIYDFDYSKSIPLLKMYPKK
ncbi:DUF2920 family protein [Paenibacillus sp. CMAA1364]